MRTYISGKITGLPIERAAEYFETIENKLAEIGHTPVNPMKLHNTLTDKTWEEFMIEDIKALFGCDAIFMLDNWLDSRGARIEHTIATNTGKTIFYSNQHNLF